MIVVVPRYGTSYVYGHLRTGHVSKAVTDADLALQCAWLAYEKNLDGSQPALIYTCPRVR